MWRKRFDTKLIAVLSVMAVLALMVSAAAIAVNSFLVRSHDTLAARNVPALELAARSLTEAEYFGSLASGFVEADTRDSLAELTTSLLQSLVSLEADLDALEQLRAAAGAAAAATPEPGSPALGDLVKQLSEKAAQILFLDRRINERSANVAQTGEQMKLLTEAEGDLARLRMTAGITDLYDRSDAALRARLDTLADRYFFAYDRLTELIHAADRVDRELQNVARISSVDEVHIARQRIDTGLLLLERRIPYLPTTRGQGTARSLAGLQRAELGEGGLLDLRQQQIALEAEVATGQHILRERVALLAEQARLASDAVQRASMAEISRTDRVARRISTAFLALAVLVVLVEIVAWLYARRELVGRLGNLARHIVSVARGNYDNPVAITGHDEIGRMEKSLNILRRRAGDGARLRGHLREEVIARTEDVVREMNIANAARAEAEAADRTKTGFLARMSHEIRTPLNGVIGMLQLLEAEQTDDVSKERVRTALTSARELMDITNDILIYSSNEDPAARTNPEHFNLRELTAQLGQQLAALAEPKRLSTFVDLADKAPPVLFGNLIRIRQVVNNLLSNAVKYTEEGSISLIVDHAADAETGRPVVSFSVSDTGIGMSRETLSRVFDHYARAADAYRAGIEGVGLGLSIARQLTEAMGGALSVESEPGLGSRFTLTVPLEIGDPDQIAGRERLTLSNDMELDVLVIEDHPVNRLVLRGYLERLGCSVVEAPNGTQGLGLAQKHEFDLILIDLDLPDMNGAEVATRLVEAEIDAKLAAVTAHAVNDTPEDRTRLGVLCILSKPVSPRALAALLSDVAIGSIETDVLAKIREDVHDLGAEITRQAVLELMRDIPTAINEIIEASPDVRRKAAHRLKGAASNFGLERLCTLLDRIEKAPDALINSLVADTRKAGETALVALGAALKAAGLHCSDAGLTKR